MIRIETAIIFATELVSAAEDPSHVGTVKFEELRREHDHVLRDGIEDAGGRVVKNTGDGVLACFPSVTAALAAAVAIQQHLERRARTAAIGMSLRIGISIGDASVDDGDYFGIPSIEATRLCARARPGEILVADPVRAMLRDRPGHRFESTEALRLKGLPEPVITWKVGWDPLPESGAALLPPRLRETPPTAYVGRSSEQGRLLESWDRAVDGHRQVVVISGEPGIGKTRLVTQAARAALPDQALILYGRCDEDQRVPYHPWLEILRDYVAVAPRRLLRPHAAELSRIVPELSQKLGTAPPPASSDPDGERYLLFAAIGSVLAAATETSPVLVILDDLHWADRPSIQLFKYLVTASATGRLMLLGTFRESDIAQQDPLSALLADLRREAAVTRMALGGLAETEIVDLIEVLAGHRIDAAGLALAGRVHRETAGNPFFVGELLRHLQETGAIAEDAHGHWSFTTQPAGHGLPQSVREVIVRRVQRLGEPARRLLDAAAVIGTEFEVELLEAAAELPAAEVLDLLEEAVAASLLTGGSVAASRLPRPGSDQVYAFSHGLVQATLYDALPAGRRIALHRAVGLAIVEIHGDQAERLARVAHHLLEAALGGDTAPAVDYATRAGQHAMSQFAYEQAEGLFGAALRMTPTGAIEQIALLQSVGEAQMRSGDSGAARRTLLGAAQAARRHDKPEALARATLACGIWGLSFGVDDALVELAEEAVSRLEGGNSRRLLAEVKGLLAAALYYAPAQSERRRRLSAEAVALAREECARNHDREAASSLAYVLGRSLLASWGPDSAEQDIDCTELLELCRQLGNGELELLVRNWRTAVLLELGDFAAADQELARVEHMATALRQPRAMVFLPLHRAMLEVAVGRLAEAERLHLESRKVGARIRNSGSDLAATAQLLGIRMLQGRMPELEGSLRAAVRAHPGMVALRCALAVLLLQAGRDAQARVELEAVMATGRAAIPRENTHVLALALLADAAAQLGDQARARSLYDWLEPYRGRWVVSAGAAVLWPVDRSLGRLAGVGGNVEVALSHLATSRTLGERVGALPTLALTALDEARLLAARGTPGDAARVAQRSREARLLAQELGMRHVIEEASRLETGSAGAVAAST